MIEDASVEDLKTRISNLNQEVIRLKAIVKKHKIEEDISDEEVICITQIKKLKDESDCRKLSLEETKVLDFLNKNLRIIRGQQPDKPKKEIKASTAELLSVVKGNK
jgi:hypothetical protein